MTDLAKGKILVTGGAGFIGSALIWELNRRGFSNILVADFLGKTAKWKNLLPLRFDDYFEADDLLRRLENSPGSLSEIATVFHLGACSSTSETDAAYLIRNNYEYTKALAAFALKDKRRFLYASSAATYGAVESGLRETTPLESLRPLNIYGYSKHLFDIHAERAGFLPQITGLKYFNVFGPNEDHKADMRSMVNKGFHQIRETGKLQLFRSYRPEFPNGGQQRDFLYVKDAVAATVFLAEHAEGGGIFNIGSGQASSWLKLAHALFDAMNLPANIAFVDMSQQLRREYQYFTCARIDKLRSAGFTQKLMSLREAIHDCVRNYLMPDVKLGDEVSSNSGEPPQVPAANSASF
jgi:ADP-L-glycero-D-manno-heptose 6-epimerase